MWQLVRNIFHLDMENMHGMRFCVTAYSAIDNYTSPGRFFAANELKAMLCFVVTNYDVQLEDGSKERPLNLYSGANVRPNNFAKVMFRRRSA